MFPFYTPENTRKPLQFSGVFRGFKTGALARNKLAEKLNEFTPGFLAFYFSKMYLLFRIRQGSINPSVSNAPFLYPLKTSEKRKVF